MREDRSARPPRSAVTSDSDGGEDRRISASARDARHLPLDAASTTPDGVARSSCDDSPNISPDQGRKATRYDAPRARRQRRTVGPSPSARRTAPAARQFGRRSSASKTPTRRRTPRRARGARRARPASTATSPAAPRSPRRKSDVARPSTVSTDEMLARSGQEQEMPHAPRVRSDGEDGARDALPRWRRTSSTATTIRRPPGVPRWLSSRKFPPLKFCDERRPAQLEDLRPCRTPPPRKQPRRPPRRRRRRAPSGGSSAVLEDADRDLVQASRSRAPEASRRAG